MARRPWNLATCLQRPVADVGRPDPREADLAPSAGLHVYTSGTVKLECPNLFGGSTVVNMLETCFIPEAKVNVFSLQKLRKTLYVTEHQDQLGT